MPSLFVKICQKPAEAVKFYKLLHKANYTFIS